MEMRSGYSNIKQGLRSFCCCISFLLLLNMQGKAQDPFKLYTVKNGKMYIHLSKNLPSIELKNFIEQFDLQHLALKRFISNGYEDSVKLAGWQVEINNAREIVITKSLSASTTINDPGDRILFTGQNPPADVLFPSVSNAVRFGYNQFRNKQSFTIKDSAVTFFFRGNDQASRVMLAGSFNNWDPGNLAMKKTDSGWIANVKLTPGKYWYKFIVDGNWVTDNDNRLSENDGQGNTNSVFYFTNYVFRLKGFGNAKKVIVAGSFNNWNEKELAMKKNGDEWELPLYIANGTHTYRFIVDKNWMVDPGNPDRVPNEHNDFNSVISIGTPHVFKLDGYTTAKKVVLSGSFNGWMDYELLMTRTATGWELPYVLDAGNYEYKFIVDGKGIADPAQPSFNTGKGTTSLILSPNYTFRVKAFESATSVLLAGDFNNWGAGALPMKKENGEWTFAVHLSPGKHLYKLIVDGKWMLDPGNKLWEENKQNTGNSVLWIEIN